MKYTSLIKKIFSFLKYSISGVLLLFLMLIVYDFIITGNFSWNTILLFSIISIIFYIMYRIFRLFWLTPTGWGAAWAGMALAAGPAAQIGTSVSPFITPIGGAVVGGVIILGTGIISGIGGEKFMESVYEK